MACLQTKPGTLESTRDRHCTVLRDLDIGETEWTCSDQWEDNSESDSDQDNNFVST